MTRHAPGFEAPSRLLTGRSHTRLGDGHRQRVTLAVVAFLWFIALLRDVLERAECRRVLIVDDVVTSGAPLCVTFLEQ